MLARIDESKSVCDRATRHYGVFVAIFIFVSQAGTRSVFEKHGIGIVASYYTRRQCPNGACPRLTQAFVPQLLERRGIPTFVYEDYYDATHKLYKSIRENLDVCGHSAYLATMFWPIAVIVYVRNNNWRFYDNMCLLVRAKDPDWEARMFADDEISNEIVLYMRFMTATELLANQADVCLHQFRFH